MSLRRMLKPTLSLVRMLQHYLAVAVRHMTELCRPSAFQEEG